MSTAPDYTAMCAEFGDPDVVLDEITEVIDQPLPRIDEAHAHVAPEDEADDEVVGGAA